MIKSAILALILLMSAGSVLAADPLPEICTGGHSMMDMGGHGAMDMGGDEGHQALMAGMAEMNSQMDQAMQAADLDVAFICGMIPHHQGAIDMAKAELAYGDDPWAKELAQKIIAAQEDEIEQMRAWLAQQPQ